MISATLRMLVVVGLVLAGTAEAAKKRKPEDATKDKAEQADPTVAGETAPKTSSNPKPAGADSVDPDKDRARFVRSLTKRFKKDDGYYVVRLIEVGVRTEGEASGPAKDKNVAYKPYSTVSFEVLSGRDAAVARIVDYLGEYNPPWEKKSSASKASRDENARVALAAPQRDWQPVGWFPQSDEGGQAAEATRTRAQQAHDAQIQAIEDRNKPKCRKCAGGG